MGRIKGQGNKIKIKEPREDGLEDNDEIASYRKTRRQRRLKEEIKHNYIPSHDVLNEEEVEELRISKGIEHEKLPLIYISDPAIRHIEVKVGDVIKIKRYNSLVGDTVYYRRVVDE
jgi:DNA-directed RNA polymerase subunit H